MGGGGLEERRRVDHRQRRGTQGQPRPAGPFYQGLIYEALFILN